ncbi:Calx-beta domain-containing protein [Planctomycetota bacterium]
MRLQTSNLKSLLFFAVVMQLFILGSHSVLALTGGSLPQASMSDTFGQPEPKPQVNVDLSGMHLVDPSVDRFDGQIVYLDFNGANNVAYNGLVTVEGIDVPAFSAESLGFAVQEDEIVQIVTQRVYSMLEPLGVEVTSQVPEQAGYSTIYIGGTDIAFAEYGSFFGLSEQIDIGNQDSSDNGFVFSDKLMGGSPTFDSYVLRLSQVIAHETGHLLGFTHNHVTSYGVLDESALVIPSGSWTLDQIANEFPQVVTKENNVYHVYEQIQVLAFGEYGDELILEPGNEVVFHFDSFWGIHVKGSGRLTANGTASEPIVLRAPSGGSWDGIFIEGGALEFNNVMLSGAEKGIYSWAESFLLRDCTIENCTTGISTGNFITVERTTFKNNRTGISFWGQEGGGRVSDCIIRENYLVGILIHTYGIEGETQILTRNTIEENATGIDYMGFGLNLGDLSNDDPTDDGGNIFRNNTQNAIGCYYAIGRPDIKAEGNDWGTTDPLVIENSIFHKVDDPSVCLVDFKPFIGLQEPTISRSPASLTPSCQQGQNASPELFEVWNSGSGTINYTISDNAGWLSCSPTSGNSTGEHDPITVNYDTSALSAGSYSATIIISDSAASNSPQIISVNLTVGSASAPTISLSPALLAPSCQQGQNAPSESFEVWNSGSSTLTYTVSDNAGWLSCSPTSGNSTVEHDTITVNYNTSTLSEGSYSGTIIIGDSAATNNPQTVSVSLTVGSTSTPTISRAPESLTSSCQQGQNASPDSFEVWNSGSGTLNYIISEYASWLSCSPTSGSSTGEHDPITVSYNTSALPAGSYYAVIHISDATGTIYPQTIVVSLIVNSTFTPTISRSTASLTPSCQQGQNASPDSFEIWNSGSGTLNYTISDNAGWLSCSPASGNSTDEHDTITVNYTTSALPTGLYSVTITISDPAATNNPQTISVSLTVSSTLTPTISRSPASFTPSCQQGQNASPESFEIWNSGTGTLDYTISCTHTWLSCSPTSGSSTDEHDTITINYTTSALSAGSYSAAIFISDPAATNNPQTISVSLTVGSTSTPTISLNPTSLIPSCQQGQNAPSELFTIWNSGSGALNYTISDSASWLSCFPMSGNSIGEHDPITVSYNTSALSAGSYSATIIISDPVATNNPQIISVSLTVGSASTPTISLSPASLTPSCQEGQNASSASFEVWNSGSGTLTYTISDSSSWILCSTTGGNSTGERDPITIYYNTSSLPAGSYSAAILVSDPAATNNPQLVSVNLTISSAPTPTISRNRTSLTPSCQQGQNAPSESFEVWNNGTGTLDYTISRSHMWLSCSPTSGTSNGEHDPITVNYDTSSLPAGSYSATIYISDPDATNNPQTISVDLTISSAPTPTIDGYPGFLYPTCEQGQDASSESFEVWNSGSGTLNYIISYNAGWLSCSPTSGDSTGEPDTVTVTYATSALPAGSYSTEITVSDPAATNDPQTVSVSLTVYAQHVVSQPSIPTGPSSGSPNTSYQYGTGGSTCSQGHSVEYRFDWDADGSHAYSSWPSSSIASHSWPSAGTYVVKAQTRCTVDHGIESVWSGGKTVAISGRETKLIAVVVGQIARHWGIEVNNHEADIAANLRTRGATVELVTVNYDGSAASLNGVPQDWDINRFDNEILDLIQLSLENLSGDGSFIFFYGGHGSFFDSDGLETPVNVNDGKDIHLNNTSDEFLYLAKALPDSATITDDRLSQLLTVYPNVKKTIILSTCFAGGFWGDQLNVNGDTDLSLIPNTGLIAGSPETDVQVFWFWNNSHAEKVAEAFEPGRNLHTFDELAEYIERETLIDYDLSSPPYFVLTELGDEISEPVCTPVSFCSSDFNTTEIMPLPSLYVSVNGSDVTGDGTKGNPYSTIQKVIDEAGPYEIIQVADGVYTGPGNKNLTWDATSGKHLIIKSENGPDNCIIDCENEGRGFILNQTGQDNTDAIIGFTITNGVATDAGGAGIWCNDVSPTIASCKLESNESISPGSTLWYGGNSHLTIIECTFIANNLHGGSAINNSSGDTSSSLVCERCLFDNNLGTPIRVWAGHVELTDCVFNENTEEGLRAMEHVSKLVVRRCIFNRNGSVVLYAMESIFENCVFSENNAAVTVLVADGQPCYFEKCEFRQNSNTITISNVGPNTIITNCLFDRNTGGGINNSGEHLSLINSVLYGNSAQSVGGGILKNGGDVSVVNSILWANTPHQIIGTVNVTFSCIQDADPFDSHVYSGLGNIDDDPLFLNAEQSDFRLQLGSPCIDTGDGGLAPETDILNNPRHDDPGTANIGIGTPDYVDIGAYEFQGTTPVTMAFDLAISSGSESVSPATLSVILSGASVQTVMVDYSVTGGTATGGGVDYTLASGTLTFSPGDTSENIELTIVDDFLFEGDETVIVTLSNPVNAELGTNSSHTYTISDNEGQPAVEFTTTSSSGSESISPAWLAVGLSGASVQTVTVDYSVTSGTAAGGGVDYTLASGTLTFSPGDTSENIELTIVEDFLFESNETVVVTLSNPVNSTLGTNVSHTYTINDIDDLPSIEFAVTGSSDFESVSPAILVVNLSGASVQTATVDYSVTGGTATGGGEDYTVTSGTLTFSPGETTKDITISIINDPTGEADESVIVTLSSPANATLGTQTSHTYTILNDDLPSIEFSSATSSGLESISPVAIVVTRLPAIAGQTATVDYSVTGGTATGGGVDYMLVSGALTFSPGDTEESIEVLVVDDSTYEQNETIIITLINPTDATIGTNTSHTYTIIDDDDEMDPYTYGHIPEPNEFNIARDTIIQLHIVDEIIASTSGVDANTVQIQVEGEVIYNGASAEPDGTYESSMGICRRVGSEADYTFIFQSSTPFDYEQKVDITVNASDKSGNAVEETYHFYTVMRSFGKNAKVNSDTSSLAQDNPASVTDSAGNIWVVWDQMNATGDKDIYLGILYSDTSSFGASTPVAISTNNEQNPSIAVGVNDVAYVTWQADDPNGHWDVFVSSSTNGTTWSAPVKVDLGDPNNTSDQMSPVIAATQDEFDTLYVACQDNRAGNYDIWLATSTSGTTWIPNIYAQITTDANDQTEPAIVVINTNIVVAVGWTDARNSSSDIYVANSDDAWENYPVVITPSYQSSFALAADPSNAHCLWVDDAGGYDDIFYGNDMGEQPFTGSSIIDEPNTIQSQPTIAVAGNSSKVFAAWTDGRNVLSNSDTDIYFAESNSPFGTINDETKSPFGHNVLVNDDIGTSSQSSPVVNVDLKGSPYIVWVDGRNGNKDIFYAGATSLDDPLPTTIVTDGNTVTIEVSTVENLQVSFSVDALPDGVDVNDVNITIAKLLNPPELPSGGFGICYDFGPSGLLFDPPATVTVPHATASCPGHSVYRVYWYNSETGTWSRDGITNVQHTVISAALHAVSFQTTHFTAIAVGGYTPDPLDPDPDPDPVDGGGGGGGCSMSPRGQGSVIEFLLPYVLLAGIWFVMKRREIQKKSRN